MGNTLLPLTPSDSSELQIKSRHLRRKFATEAVKREHKSFIEKYAKRGCCPPFVSFYIASGDKPGGDKDVRGSFDYRHVFNGRWLVGNGAYPDDVWYSDESNIDLFIAIGGVGFGQLGAGKLVDSGKNYCKYSVTVDTTFDDSFSFSPISAADGLLPTQRLANRYYNTAHFLQKTNQIKPVTWSDLISEKMTITMSIPE